MNVRIPAVQFPDFTLPNISTNALRQRLLAWYDGTRRDLPWRRNHDPYRVWLSEIMLQQTRVAAVIEHYQRFLKRFPTIEKLAAAREASVLAAWSGLGYYRRARMLHAAAKQIVKDHGGVFPGNAEALRGIAGIGRYTAAAVASIAFAEPVAAVDGNIERVMQRLAGKPLEREQVWQRAQRLLFEQRPGDFNQAVMELGATVCVPRRPKCMFCPIAEFCATRGDLPQPKKAVPQRKRDIYYALHRENGSVLLMQRPADASLMPGMWELPEASSTDAEPAFTLRHAITVTDYTVRVVEPKAADYAGGCWIQRSRLPRMPLTGLARKILRTAKII